MNLGKVLIGFLSMIVVWIIPVHAHALVGVEDSPVSHGNEMDLLPLPPELRADVLFWERIYGRIDGLGGLLHDDRQLNVVYEQVIFNSTDHNLRVLQVDHERELIQNTLRALASHPLAPANNEERRVWDLWGGHASTETLLDAADHVRFQLGQADRVRAGLARAMAWQLSLQRTMQAHDVPVALWALPLVESSFNPRALSKVGAGGMWQLMPEVSKGHLKMDESVDERFDPFKSSDRAAEILANNARVLKSWPLAITAYNHGLTGTLHAKTEIGSDNIVALVRSYHGPGFGFASRNFYVAFLAAYDIASHPNDYFGTLDSVPEWTAMTANEPLTVSQWATRLRVTEDELKAYNPQFKAVIWRNQQTIPVGSTLWMSVSTARAYANRQINARLDKAQSESAQNNPINPNTPKTLRDTRQAAGMAVPVKPVTTQAAAVSTHSKAAVNTATRAVTVVAGDSFERIAMREHISVERLLSLNHLKIHDTLLPGQHLVVAQSKAN
jgi:membrane-bound lytic murein transglycosylase D